LAFERGMDTICRDVRYRHIRFFGGRREADRPAPTTRLALPSRPVVPPSSSSAVIDRVTADFLAWLLDQGGLDWRDYRPETLMRRLPACLRVLRAASLTEARVRLERKPALASRAIDALVLGVTSFFRDRSVYDALDEEIFNRWARPRRRLRVWSAGCSTGAELYSVGILLARHGLLDRCELFGSDCRVEAVTRAAAGRYDRSELAGIEPDVLAEFFLDSDGSGYHVRPSLRERAGFAVANLLDLSPAGGSQWDLILCRNVSIYLRAAPAAAIWTRLAARLRHGGLLVVGKAEHPGGGAPWKRRGACIYERT
jgi:chemotaxis methyl-accepting protein methylase